MEFKSKLNETIVFRELNNGDGIELGSFFESLSPDTRSKYGPHPLNSETALLLCGRIGCDNSVRFAAFNGTEIIGYFILDFNTFEHDAARYLTYGIELDPKIDPLFAPCIADSYQNRGIAAGAMKGILDYCRKKKIRSIVLMGGTQEPNVLARSFYKKAGFEEYGTFYTDYNGLNNVDMMMIV